MQMGSNPQARSPPIQTKNLNIIKKNIKRKKIQPQFVEGEPIPGPPEGEPHGEDRRSERSRRRARINPTDHRMRRRSEGCPRRKR